MAIKKVEPREVSELEVPECFRCRELLQVNESLKREHERALVAELNTITSKYNSMNIGECAGFQKIEKAVDFCIWLGDYIKQRITQLRRGA